MKKKRTYVDLVMNRWLPNEEDQRNEAFKYFLQTSKQGDKKIQFLLAKCFEGGVGTEEDSNEALKWYLKSAEQGFSLAQFIVADYYYFGRGIEKDLKKALDYYIKSAEQGNFDAKKGLGRYYSTTEDVEENFEKAYNWYKKAYTNFNKENPKYLFHRPDHIWLAEQCLDVAKKILETAYITKLKGGGYSHDFNTNIQTSKAIFWYKKAVDLGNGNAMHLLGECYKNGSNGLERNSTKAIDLFQKALKNKADKEINILLNIADIQTENKKIKEAIVIYKRALKLLYSIFRQSEYDIYVYDDIEVIEKKLEKIGVKRKKLLFFDTETTGVPKNWKAPVSDTQNWPRLVQIAWQLYDEDKNLIQSYSNIIEPDNFDIPMEASNVHGITTDRAYAEGEELIEVLRRFKNMLKEANLLIAHNMSFDEKIIGAEFYRLSNSNPLSKIKKLCTMKKSTNICKIEGAYGYKWPKLQELHYFLFNEEFEDAHNAEADIQATADCYFELKRRTLI